MGSSTPLPIALGRFKQLPQRSNEVWQGGLVKLPAWVDNPDDPDCPPYRPMAALWVSLRTGLLHLALADKGTVPTPDLAVKALIEFGLKESKRLDGRPAVIEVREPLAKALSDTLSALNTSIRVTDDLPAVANALRSLETSLADGPRHAGMLEDTGVMVDDLRAFADAAAIFFRAAPWRHLTNEDLIAVEATQVPTTMRHFCVLGNAGEQFGLAFFESRQAFERIYSGEGNFLPRRAFGVTYGPIDDLPFADVDAWEDLGLPVVNSRAYPLAADLAIDGTMRRLNAGELAAAEALLRALALTTEDELDSGSWRLTVDTYAGPVTLDLTLPLLLEAERGRHASGPNLGALPRMAERARLRSARLADNRSFEILDEAKIATQGAEGGDLLEKNAEAAAGRPLTTLEQAQELAYDAMEASGRLKIKLAKRALSVSPDCADAYVILGETSTSPEEARDWYQRGVETGARAIGADNFAALRGKFWEHLETRPYMRARLALARTLRELGHENEALEHYRELLRLNPNDNQGVRHLLLPALLRDGQHEEVDHLLGEYDGDIQAMWPYARALRAFQLEGDGNRARTGFENAIRVNPHVVGYLVDPETIPPAAPPYFALGSPEEAACVAEALRAAFEATPGAVSWLRAIGTQVARRRDRVRRQKHSRRR
jgi:tetratricopeptide (TPR) repeat protein